MSRFPLDCISETNVSQGTIVDSYTHIDGILVVQPRAHESDPTEEVTVNIEPENAKQVEQLVRAASANGCDEFTLVSSSAFTDAQRRAVDDVAGTIAGTATTVESKNRLSVQIPLDSEEISVRQLVRQLAFVTLSMHRESVSTNRWQRWHRIRRT